MKFRIGQRVICVNDTWNMRIPYPLHRGAVYTISGFYKCECGSEQVTLEEVPFIINMICRCKRSLLRRQSYYKWRFAIAETHEESVYERSKSQEPAGAAELKESIPYEESIKESSMV